MDSSFYAPGAGGGASALTGLTDTNIVDPGIGQTLVYDGTDWINEDPLNVELATIKGPATGRYYFPRSQTAFGGFGGYNAFLAPIRFDTAVTINKFILGLNYNPPSTQGNGGLKLRAYIYNSNDQGLPSNLHKDMGYFTIAASDQGGPSGGPQQFTLASTTTIQANSLHYVGFAYGPINPAAGNHGNWVMEYGGLTDPYYNAGIADSTAQYMVSVSALYNGSTDWSTFDYQNGTLPNNIHNNLGYTNNNPRIGLRVNALA